MQGVEAVYKKSVVIGWALFVDILIFVAIVEFIRNGFAPFEGFWDSQNFQIVRYIFYGLALSQYFLIQKLSDLPLKNGSLHSQQIRLGRLRASTLIRYGLIESVAVSGLLLFMLFGLYLDFYVLLAISMFYLALFYPRLPEWKSWLNELEC